MNLAVFSKICGFFGILCRLEARWETSVEIRGGDLVETLDPPSSISNFFAQQQL